MWSPVTGGHPGDQPTPGEPTYATASTTLYLVDPAGGRYTITTFPPPGDKAAPELADWSGDGSRALFYTRSSGQTVIEVDLHTGTQTTFTVNGQVTPRYTRPNGKAVMLVGTHTLERVDLAGNHQLTYPVGKDTRGYVYTPDGTQLVLGTDSGLALMGNDGTAGRELPVPGQTGCTQTRFWDTGSTIVVASCRSANYQSQLWLVPIDGGTPTALTAPNNGQVGPDYGDLDAWQLPAGTFVQAAGACGVIFLGPPVNGGGVIRALAYSRQE
jgi:TolB protein